MLLWALVACGSQSVGVPGRPVAVVDGPNVDARAWALRAYRAELLGDDVEADRSWQWARRADDVAAVFHGESLARRGRVEEAAVAFRAGLTGELDQRARLGLTSLGMGAAEWQPRLREERPCRVWWVTPGPQSEAACRGR